MPQAGKNFVHEMNDKNHFYKLCTALDIPVLRTECSDTLIELPEILAKLGPLDSYIFKPSEDRMNIDGRQRKFIVSKDASELTTIVGDVFKSKNFPYQVQEYIDYSRSPVRYYNSTYLITDTEVKHHFITEQIINLVGIHNNLTSSNWLSRHRNPKNSHFGNRSINAATLSDLSLASSYCDQLVEHYRANGYLGELGIDFGLTENRLFFLETNARENNATRLYYFLNEMNIEIPKKKFIFLWKHIFEAAVPASLIDENPVSTKVVQDVLGDKILLWAEDEHLINEIYTLVSHLAHDAYPNR
ncbi:hypothetical protein [uncultured Herbaspirillum sp.]|uniref:hypothetical protein n=1 Tax=uncultured Herbaspirillum sp. TaxID=160236 RepID=UPI00258A975F|nr:hypothetical protein [uncultured Herbaspirillum sp.]